MSPHHALSLLQARIGLYYLLSSSLSSVPCSTSLSVAREVTKRSKDFGWALEELNGKTARNVEWDMAVKQPSSRIVSLEGQDCVATSSWDAIVSLNNMSVAADGIIESVSWVECTISLSDDPEIMSVQVDWVRKRRVVNN